MLRIRHVIIVIGMLFYTASSSAQLSISIGLPNVSIGINLPVYPRLVRVPGYPVYYAPQLEANFFFYDGLYWVYQDDDWYASSWYNGPWALVEPEVVPLFVLRIPVRYYRQPPAYFHGWRHDAPPRWGDHWGRDWEQRRSGWDKWNRDVAPAPAPLPSYQRQYSRERYPQQVEQQQEVQRQHYRYQPRDPVVRQHYQERAVPRVPAQQGIQSAPKERGAKQQDNQAAPRAQSPQREQQMQRSENREEIQQSQDAARDKRQQDKDAARKEKRKKQQEKERGQDRNE